MLKMLLLIKLRYLIQRIGIYKTPQIALVLRFKYKKNLLINKAKKLNLLL